METRPAERKLIDPVDGNTQKSGLSLLLHGLYGNPVFFMKFQGDSSEKKQLNCKDLERTP